METENYLNFSKSKGHNSAENYSTRPNIKLNLRILVASLCTKFHLKILMYNRENERELNPEGQNDGRTERGNTICPGHFHGGA